MAINSRYLKAGEMRRCQSWLLFLEVRFSACSTICCKTHVHNSSNLLVEPPFLDEKWVLYGVIWLLYTCSYVVIPPMVLWTC